MKVQGSSGKRGMYFNCIDRGKFILYFLMNFNPKEKLWLIG